eukprot:892564-Rhodomonas_salina.1
MGAARDAVQLGLLLAFFAIGVQWMRNTDGGQQFLFATRQYILELLSPGDRAHVSTINPAKFHPSDHDVAEHKTLRGTTTKASSPGEALQPEAVRKAAPAVRPEGHEMKCNEEIPVSRLHCLPYNIWRIPTDSRHLSSMPRQSLT